jgi:hypothetical protein
MGDKVWDWFLPIRPTPGDGVRFEYNQYLVDKLRKRARKILRAQSAQSTSNTGGNRLFPGLMDEKEVSTLSGSVQRV